jgi:hypothetical protein
MPATRWCLEYKGQSPGDLQNKNNGFAGRFAGYHSLVTNPEMVPPKLIKDLPIVLIMGDSIIGDFCYNAIQLKLNGIAYVSFLQHPHHCKNIESWLNDWKVDTWKHYSLIFYFDGMHGFPSRVTEEEHQELTPKLMNRLHNTGAKLLWGNCTPIPDSLPLGMSNSEAGPNTKEQVATNESVLNRNISIRKTCFQQKIPLVDLYSLTYPLIEKIQLPVNIHFNHRGQIIMGNIIGQEIKTLLQKNES